MRERVVPRLRELGLTEMVMDVQPDGSFAAFLDIQGHRVWVYRRPAGTRPNMDRGDFGVPCGTSTSRGRWDWFIGWDDDIDEELWTGQEKPYAMCSALTQDPVLGEPLSAEERGDFEPATMPDLDAP